ncbi:MULTISPECIES: hypothetical protein [Streptosporangium]|uniref:Uncharacterized protein n=1 Tax=Streptosporangium sandarakinum TaxID=1260955 RepID=A0A852UX67_9ACTN|nr:hypothetical protein [Streptosporangium sandarakinum]NYF38331.1 hypothetical protein [Streptosporangium sandarakinum]
MNDHAAPEEAAEDGGPVEESRDPAGKRHGGAPDDPPPAPRGIDGESRVVAERSGADATFPDRPLPADLPPDDLGDLVGGPAPATGERADGGEGSGKRAPEPEMGPAS